MGFRSREGFIMFRGFEEFTFGGSGVGIFGGFGGVGGKFGSGRKRAGVRGVGFRYGELWWGRRSGRLRVLDW